MRRTIGVVVFDIVIVGLLYFVLQDLAYRSYYALHEANGLGENLGLGYSVTYYPFIKISHITGNVQFTLTSPPTLDWVQVIIALLVVVNGYYLISLLRERRAATPPTLSGSSP